MNIELENNLGEYIEEFNKRINEIPEELPFEDLFSNKFMTQYTEFDSIYTLLDATGYKASSNEDFEKIPEDELNKFIANHTKFSSWDSMFSKASEEYSKSILDF